MGGFSVLQREPKMKDIMVTNGGKLVFVYKVDYIMQIAIVRYLDSGRICKIKIGKLHNVND